MSADAVTCRLDENVIDMADLQADVQRPGCGAITTFAGIVRSPNRGHDVLYLEYECHPRMTRPQLGELASRTYSHFHLGAVSVAHRLGRVRPGEISMGIAVSSPHRPEALRALEYLVEAIKADLLVWKKEVTPAGSFWSVNDMECSSSTEPSAAEN